MKTTIIRSFQDGAAAQPLVRPRHCRLHASADAAPAQLILDAMRDAPGAPQRSAAEVTSHELLGRSHQPALALSGQRADCHGISRMIE